MGNRVGIIFHNNWEEFSPLLYSHQGGYRITKEFIEEFIDSYRELYPVCDDGHKYDCDHMMYGFIQTIGVDLHNRISSIDDAVIKDTKTYRNAFDCGCFLVNVNFNTYGEIINT